MLEIKAYPVSFSSQISIISHLSHHVQRIPEAKYISSLQVENEDILSQKAKDQDKDLYILKSQNS